MINPNVQETLEGGSFPAATCSVSGTPRTDAAYFASEGDDADRIDALLKAGEQLERENSRMRWLIRQVCHDLPSNRDWLNPEYEREMEAVAFSPNRKWE